MKKLFVFAAIPLLVFSITPVLAQEAGDEDDDGPRLSQTPPEEEEDDENEDDVEDLVPDRDLLANVRVQVATQGPSPAPNAPLTVRFSYETPEDNMRLSDVTLDGTPFTCSNRVRTSNRTTLDCSVQSLPQTIDVTEGFDVTLTLRETERDLTVPYSTSRSNLNPDLNVGVSVGSDTVQAGQTVTLTVNVTNPSNTVFSQIVMSGGCTPAQFPLRNFGPDDTFTGTCALPAPTEPGPYDVTFRGTWEDFDGTSTEEWSDTYDLDVTGVDVDIVSTSADLVPGGNIELGVRVRNPGSLPVTPSGAATIDGQAGDCDFAAVAAGDTVTFTCAWDDLEQTFGSNQPMLTAWQPEGSATIDVSTNTGLQALTLTPEIFGTLTLPDLLEGETGTADISVTVEGDVQFDSVVVQVETCDNAVNVDVASPGDTDTGECQFEASFGRWNTAEVEATYQTANGPQTFTRALGTEGGNISGLRVSARTETLRLDVEQAPAFVLFDVVASGTIPITDIEFTSTVDGCDETFTELQSETVTLVCEADVDTSMVRANVSGTAADTRVERSASTEIVWRGFTVEVNYDGWDRRSSQVPVVLTFTNVSENELSRFTAFTRPSLPGCVTPQPVDIDVDSVLRTDCDAPVGSLTDAATNEGATTLRAIGSADGRPVERNVDMTIDLNGHIVGTVVNRRGEPVEDVEVNAVLREALWVDDTSPPRQCPWVTGCGATSRQAVTGEDGSWAIASLPPGRWNITLDTPRRWAWAENEERTLTVEDVEILSGRNWFEPETLDLNVVSNPALVERVPMEVWAGLAGGVLLFALIFGVIHYRKGGMIAHVEQD